MVRAMVLAAALIALCVPAAQAQYRPWRSERDYAPRASEQPNSDRQDTRRAPNRDDDDRRVLTPDERRDLRRDLQRANEEFYRKGKDRKRRR